MLARAIDQLVRREGPTVLAGLIRWSGDFDLAEEAFQVACAQALEAWPVRGLPRRPGAWLTTVARRRAVDLMRRRRPDVPLEPGLLEALGTEEAEPDPVPEVEDDRLRLLFTVCHPALAPRRRSPSRCGRCAGSPPRRSPAPTSSRRPRPRSGWSGEAEDRRGAHPLRGPGGGAARRAARGVLSTIYLVFNEGFSATEGESWIRADLCTEAIRLGRLVLELLPGQAEAEGLLALMLLHDARRASRTGADGTLVPLEAQDRTLWARALIGEGTRVLDHALALGRPGPYQMQAAIAALHARAARPEDTDWPQIAALYGALLRVTPGPIVELNAAAAVAMAHGPEAGLEWMERLERSGALAGYHLLPAAQADLLRRLGRTDEARVAYRRALELVRHPAERRFLERRLGELS
jgi:RNA polymerase sigma-70 factor (ECF subfamily)